MKKIYSAAMTPLTENGEIDVPSLERMLERNIAHGVDGFFFMGTMGEWSQLLDKQKELLVSEACRIIGDKAEKIVGISSTGLEPVLDNMKKMSKYDFDSYVALLPGITLCRIDPVEFLLKVADEADRPVYYYHNPIVTGIKLTADDLVPILSHKNIKGLKNSSGDMTLRKELVMKKKNIDFVLFEGNEWAVDEALMIGCDGALVGMCSLASKAFKALSRAVDEEDYGKAKDIQHDIIRIFWAVYGKDFSTVWLGQKHALKKLGIFTTDKTLYQGRKALTEERIKGIDQCLEKYKDFLD